MVEFEEFPIALPWFDRLEDTGKQVKLDLLGGTIEMDRGMLDRMTPALSICYATAQPTVSKVRKSALRLEKIPRVDHRFETRRQRRFCRLRRRQGLDLTVFGKKFWVWV
jgi:hypothetical protein